MHKSSRRGCGFASPQPREINMGLARIKKVDGTTHLWGTPPSEGESVAFSGDRAGSDLAGPSDAQSARLSQQSSKALWKHNIQKSAQIISEHWSIFSGNETYLSHWHPDPETHHDQPPAARLGPRSVRSVWAGCWDLFSEVTSAVCVRASGGRELWVCHTPTRCCQ